MGFWDQIWGGIMKNYCKKLFSFPRFFTVFLVFVFGGVLLPNSVFARSSKKDRHQKQRSVEVVVPAADESHAFSNGVSGSSYQKMYGGSGLGGLVTGLSSYDHSNPEVARLIKEAEQAAKQLEVEVDDKVSDLKRAAEKSIDQIRGDVENRAAQVKQEYEEQAAKVRQEGEAKSQELLREAAKNAMNVQQKTEHEALLLKKNAAYKVISLINRADEEAMLMRKKIREDAALKQAAFGKFIAGRDVHDLAFAKQPDSSEASTEEASDGSGKFDQKIPVTKEWKEVVWREFNADAALMKKIIMDGEDKTQLPGYLKLFTDQSYWFDKMLTNTHYVGDSHYSLLIDKKMRVGGVVTAQRKADAFLVEIAKYLKLAMPDFKKARLLVLYELNSFAQKVPTSESQEKNFVFNDQLIRYFVLKIVDEVSGRAKEFASDFKIIDEKEVQLMSRGTSSVDLEKEISQLKLALTKEAEEKNRLHDVSKQKLEMAHSESINFEVQLKTTENNLGRYKDATQKLSAQKSKLVAQVESLGKDLYDHELQLRSMNDRLDLSNRKISRGYNGQNEFKKDMAIKLESKEKDFLDLKLLLTGVQQKVDYLGKQLVQAHENVDKSKIELELAGREMGDARKKVESLHKAVKEGKKKQKYFEAKASLIEETADKHTTEFRGKVQKRMSKDKKTIQNLKHALKEKEKQLTQAENIFKEKEKIFVQKNENIKKQEQMVETLGKNIEIDKEKLDAVKEEARSIDVLAPVEGMEGSMSGQEDSLKVRRDLQENENKKILEQEIEQKMHAVRVIAETSA